MKKILGCLLIGGFTLFLCSGAAETHIAPPPIEEPTSMAYLMPRFEKAMLAQATYRYETETEIRYAPVPIAVLPIHPRSKRNFYPGPLRLV